MPREQHDGERTELHRIFGLLLDRYGPQQWWPAETPFEVCVGAVLTQNTNWGNVEKAIANLRRAGMLSPDEVRNLPREMLAELIRPAGFFNVKAVRLAAFVDWLFERYGGSLDRMFAGDWLLLREGLLRVKGIGRETADSILLYAGGKPTFVVDAYTIRLFSRLGVVTGAAGYEEVRALFMAHLPADPRLFNEYHALIVRHGKEHCRSRPGCPGCSLHLLCSHGRGLHPVAPHLLGPV